MTARDPKPGQKKSLLISLATGALLVPLAAYGASSLVNAPSSAEPASTSTTVSPATTSTIAAAQVGPAALDLACGEEGMQLVAAEADGSISDVQKAALDALRDVCADEGRPLPGAPLMAQTTTPSTVAVQSTTVGTSPDSDHDDDDDDDRDDDWDDDGDHGGHGRGGDDDDHEDDD